MKMFRYFTLAFLLIAAHLAVAVEAQPLGGLSLEAPADGLTLYLAPAVDVSIDALAHPNCNGEHQLLAYTLGPDPAGGVTLRRISKADSLVGRSAVARVNQLGGSPLSAYG